MAEPKVRPMRFHAYGVGLPKTGSTSLAQVFRRFETRHEWDMLPLLDLGQARASGRIDDKKFWEVAGPRLTPPFLELDVCTAHHVYVDLLIERYPNARFVHVTRGVGSWANSMLDMGWRMRRARAQVSMPTDDWKQASQLYAGITVDADPQDLAPDVDALPGLLSAWAQHMRTMDEVMPPGRTFRVRTGDLSSRWPEIADFLGADAALLDLGSAPTRVSPLTFDRFRLAPTEVASLYEETCADLMADQFPEEHERVMRSFTDHAGADEWSDYVAATDDWVARAIAHYGPVMTT